MKIELKDIPSTGCVKLLAEDGDAFTVSRYEVRSDLSILVVQSEHATTVHVEDAKKHWHLDASKYEYHPNIRLILTGADVMLEPGTEAPNFWVRG